MWKTVNSLSLFKWYFRSSKVYNLYNNHNNIISVYFLIFFLSTDELARERQVC